MNTRRGQGRNEQSRFRRTFELHRDTALLSAQRLKDTPFSSAITVLVIAIALVLPGLLYLINTNLALAVGQTTDSTRLSVFLERDLDELEEIDVSNRLQTLGSIESVEFISSNRALEDFANSTGLASVLGSLPSNPLPASVIATPTLSALANLDALVSELEAVEGVELVQLDRLWIQRLQALADLIDTLGRLLMLVVLTGLVAIIGNTIKLAIEHRRQEIRVIKLIGGTDSYIARPFLYTGLYLGLAGGILACALLVLLGYSLGEAAESLSLLYGSEWRLETLSIGGIAVLSLLGAATGWVAAIIASYRNITTIDA